MKTCILLGAFIGFFVGGMYISISSEHLANEDRVKVTFFPETKVLDLGNGHKIQLPDSRHHFLITRRGHSNLADEVRITFLILRILIGAALGAIIGLILGLGRRRRPMAVAWAGYE